MVARSSVTPEAGALRRIQLFAELDPDTLETIRGQMRVRVVEPGAEIIAAEDTEPGEVFFLLSGRAQVALTSPEGKFLRLHEVGPGEVLGDIAVIDGAARSAGVESLATCRLAVMDGAAFLRMVTTIPEVCLAMLRFMAARTRRQNARAFESVTLDAPRRIAAELLRLAEAGGGVIDPAPKQGDIAATIGARRETVSRLIAKLTREGVLEKQGAAIRADLAALARRAAPAAD